jgi:phosphomannomutase
MAGIDKSIFRAYDIRGIYGESLDNGDMYAIGKGLGTFMNCEGVVCVGRDIRKSSPGLESSLINGVLSTGMSVIHVGKSSFGVSLFTGWKNEVKVNAYITASHLGPEWNGVKFYSGEGIGFAEEDNMRIRDIVLQEAFMKGEHPGVIKPVKAMREEYAKFMKRSFKPARKLKVVVDCGNGSMSLSAPATLKSVGMEVLGIFSEINPDFPNRDIDPKPEALDVLKETVTAENADFGVAFDGDGDRGVIVDDKGRVLTADQTGVILAKEVLKEASNKDVVVNVECSMIFEKLLKGARIHRIPVGHTFMTLEAKKLNACIGVESSSHIIIPKYFLFDDALITPMKMAEILSKSKKPLSKIVDAIPVFPKERINFNCPDDRKFRVIDSLREEFKQEFENVNVMDGVRVDFDYGWILLRASNTGPKIRLTVEAENEKKLRELQGRFTKKLQKALESP